jgi:exosortase/archaeosortase family protein
MAVGIALILGSFGFNSLCGSFTGDYDYGLTDYVILVVGVFSIFYSIGAALVRFGMILLVFLRSVTLGLSVVSASLFAAVSEVFVDMVVSLSRFIVSPDITAGTVSGEIIVGGAAGNSSVFIGWACAGLEELVLISVILYLLIDSFRLSLSKTGVWLALGIAGSFLINILRMVVLVWIAFSRGVEDMLWVHTHLGDVLFLIWIAAFWVVFFKVAKPTSQSTSQ